MLDLLVLLAVVLGGGTLAAYGWRAFTAHAEKVEHARQLQEVERSAEWDAERHATERAAIHDWADEKLYRHAAKRGARHDG